MRTIAALLAGAQLVLDLAGQAGRDGLLGARLSVLHRNGRRGERRATDREGRKRGKKRGKCGWERGRRGEEEPRIACMRACMCNTHALLCLSS